MTTPPTAGMPVGPGGPGCRHGAAAPGREGAQPTVVVASYGEYAEAQRAIDYLSDEGFPVEHTAIVGTGVRLVEQVLGRMTTGRAAIAGLMSGAWFGLFIGLLFGLFSDANWFVVVLTAVLIGAAWGAIFGAIAHSASRGRRDFTSRSTLQASEYAITVSAAHAEQARQLLVRLNWRTNTPPSA